MADALMTVLTFAAGLVVGAALLLGLAMVVSATDGDRRERAILRDLHRRRAR